MVGCHNGRFNADLTRTRVEQDLNKASDDNMLIRELTAELIIDVQNLMAKATRVWQARNPTSPTTRNERYEPYNTPYNGP